MAKVPTIKPRLEALRPRLQAPKDEAGRTKFRREAAPWRAWYNTARWQRLRWHVLRDDLFTCRICKRIEGNTSQLVADHIIPHRGDEVLFYDRANLWCVCKACHDTTCQSIEVRHDGFGELIRAAKMKAAGLTS